MTGLGTGAAWEQARALLRGRFTALVQIVVIVLIPFMLVQFALVVLGLRGSDNSRLFSLSAGHIVVYAASLMLGVCGLTVAIAGCHRLLMAARDDEPEVDADDALRALLAQLGPVLAVAALTGLAVTVGAVLFILPAIWCAVTFSLATPVLLFEELEGTRALDRARELASGHWPVLFRQLAPAGLALIVAVAVVTIAVSAFFGGEVTIGSAFVQAAAMMLIGAALTPAIAALVHVAYLDRTGAIAAPAPAVATTTRQAPEQPSASVAPPGGAEPEPEPEPEPDTEPGPQPETELGPADPSASPALPAGDGGRSSVAPPSSSIGPPGAG